MIVRMYSLGTFRIQMILPCINASPIKIILLCILALDSCNDYLVKRKVFGVNYYEDENIKIFSSSWVRL